MQKVIFIILIFLVPLLCPAQLYEVSGRVIDASSREPLPFVNIVINQGNRGGTTDIDGKFHFRSEQPVVSLSLSYIGYESMVFPIDEESSGLVIRMKKINYELPEIVVYPTENPAHRIISNAIAHRDMNDPEKLPAFSYTSYDKMIFTFELDSLPMIDTISIDTADQNLRKYLEDHYLFMMETVSERKFKFPDNNHEEIIATKVAGMKDPIIVFLLSQFQSTSFYKERITISDKNYINPITPGSDRKYFFLLSDTLYSDRGDTVFIISYQPRKNTNFDGLKGVISINTNRWAIQNVIAEPAGPEKGFSLRIEQMYEFIQNKQWFPVQLNTEVIFNQLSMTDSTLEISSGRTSDTSGVKYESMTFGKGKGYIRDINLDPGLHNRDFSNIEVEVDPNASRRNPDYWLGYRVDSLSAKEINTYEYIDSVGKEINLDRVAKTIETLITGKIPWGYVDLDMFRFIGYNSYEGLSLGLGLHTSDRLSQIFKTGGYFRYGFKDKTLKYGGDLSIMIHSNADLHWKMEYQDDVTETGGVVFWDDQQRLLIPENYRNFLITRMDRTKMAKTSVGFRTLKYLSVYAGFGKTTKEVTNDYRYGVSDQSLTVYFDEYDFSELTLGFRYAYGEKFIKTITRKIPIKTNNPVFWFQYTRGFRGFLEGDFDYSRYDFKVEKSFFIRYLGESSVKITAGYIDGDIPSTNLYNGHGSYRTFTIFAPNSFATMRMNEFLSSRYITFYLTHNFGKLIYQGDRFKPELAIATNIGFGRLDNPENHYYIDYKTPEHGYYESGVLVNDLLNLKIYTLGLGVFYRYGPYTLENGFDNVAAKFTLKIGF
jgi:hypothetical protein